MTKKDIDDLFALLRICRQGDRRVDDPQLRSAWLMVLKPYRREDVKAALTEHLRKSKFFPDPSEIAVLCPPPAEAEISQPAGGKPRHVSADIWTWWQTRQRARRAAGLPSMAEAMEAGQTAREYLDLCDRHGIP